MSPTSRAWLTMHRIADKQTAKVRDEFIQAMQDVASNINLISLAAAIERRDLRAIEALLHQSVPAELAAAVSIIRKVTVDAMVALAPAPALARNAFVIAAQKSATLVTAVTSETRQAIRQVIVAGQRDGLSPQQMATQIRSLVGLTARQASAVDKLRRQLGAEGKSQDAINAAADRYAARLLRQRARTIARTETIKAANRGQEAIWQQMTHDGLIPRGALKRWIVTPDDRLCPVCAAVGGQEVPLNDAFQTGYGPVQSPPAHPNCRCAMGLVAASLRVPAGQPVPVAA